MPLEDGRYTVPGGPPRPLDRALRQLDAGLSWAAARQLVRRGKIRVGGAVVTDPTLMVRAGVELEVTIAARRLDMDAKLPADALVHVDSQVVVVRKPPGVSTVPYDDERDTLEHLVRARLTRTGARGASLGVVHRLDKETSGLLVFARTLPAKRHLEQQFRAHTVERRYVALAHGQVHPTTIESRLVADRGDGKRGSTRHPQLGRVAVTHVRVLEPLVGATLIECRLETGRTHQIRIHLSESGHPLLGDRVYRSASVAPISAPRLMLHARCLGFVHPATGRTLRFEEPLPADLLEVLERLRRPS